MIAVIFEVVTADGRSQDYLDLAASLRPELEKVDGFISIERFNSLSNEARYFPFHFGEMKNQSHSGGSWLSTGQRKWRGAAASFVITGCALLRY